MSDIFHHLPTLAAGARNFVSQLDAPTLHDRLNKMANACDEAHVEIERLRATLLKCKSGHRYCEDKWYSCPKAPEGCANDGEGSECNCGADERNAEIDAALNHQT